MEANRIRHVAEIGGDRNLDAFGAEREAYGIGGIVRDGEAGDINIAHLKRGAGREQLELGRVVFGPRRVLAENRRRRQPRHVNRDVELAGDHLQARDVVAVLVRDQDRSQSVGVDADGVKALEGFLARESRIYQQARALGGN